MRLEGVSVLLLGLCMFWKAFLASVRLDNLHRTLASDASGKQLGCCMGQAMAILAGRACARLPSMPAETRPAS